MSIYYVYIYINPINNVPFYVGYGKNARHLSHLKEAKRKDTKHCNKHKLNSIRKIWLSGLEPTIIIVDKNLSKDDARELEKFLISEIGRRDLDTGPLTNLTVGGDGGFSQKCRNIVKEKSKNTTIVKDCNGENIQKMSIYDERYLSGEFVSINKGRIISDDERKIKSIASSLYQSHPDYKIMRSIQANKRYESQEYADYVQNAVDQYWSRVMVDPSYVHHKPFLGKFHTQETKTKQSESTKYRPKYLCPHCDRVINTNALKAHLTKTHKYTASDVEKFRETNSPIILNNTLQQD